MAALEPVAEHHGYSGIEQLMYAIASGEIALVLLADGPRNAAIRRLRELALGEHPTVREAFEDIASALEHSIERELGDWYEDRADSTEDKENDKKCLNSSKEEENERFGSPGGERHHLSQ